MVEVFLVQDESSHWYCIPGTLKDKWDKLESIQDEDDYENAFQDFEKYYTGGGPNSGPKLFADIK